MAFDPVALETFTIFLAQTENAAEATDAAGFGMRDWMNWLGRWHFVVLHLPIGLLAGVYLIDLTWIFRKAKREGLVTAGSTLLMLAMITAVIAALFGWFLHETAMFGPAGNQKPLYPEESIGTHQWLGIGLAAVTILAWFIRTLAFKPDGKTTRFLYPLVLIASAVLLFFTGHTGGSSVHGETHLTRDAPPVLAPYLKWMSPDSDSKSDSDASDSDGAIDTSISSSLTDSPNDSDSAESVAGIDPTDDSEEVSFYETRVWPIFEQECLYCHDATKSLGNLYRGGYDMSSFEGLLAGGVTGLDAVIPSDPEGSELMRRLLLPQDDGEVMPKGAEKLSDDQIELIRLWIAAGASPTAPVSDFIVAPDASETPATESETNPTDPAESQDDASNASALADPAVAAAISRLTERRVTVTPIFLGSDLLDVSFTSIAGQTADDALLELAPIASQIQRLDLQRTAVTDSGMQHLQDMTQLRRLILRGTSVGDAGVAAIVDLPSLERLVLFDTAITDASVDALAAMSKLDQVEVGDSQMTETGIAALREKRPDLTVND